MKSKRAELFIFLLLFNLFASYAQSRSYYVLDDSTMILSDRVLDDNARINSRRVRVEVDSQIQTYNPNEVSEFGTSLGDVFVSVKFASEFGNRLFFQRHTAGEISLLQLHITSMAGLFVMKNNQLQRLTRRNFRTVLISMMENCPYVDGKIEMAKLTQNSLTKLINHYNSCSTDDWLRVSYGIRPGISLQENRLQMSTKRFWPKPVIRSLGAWVEIPISSVTALSGGATFWKEKYERSFDESVDPTMIAERTVSQSATFLTIPVALKFTTSSSQGVYVLGGFEASFQLTDNLKYYQTIGSRGVNVPVFGIDGFEYPRILFGQFIGLGGYVKWKSGKRWRLELELRRAQARTERVILRQSSVGVSVLFEL